MSTGLRGLICLGVAWTLAAPAGPAAAAGIEAAYPSMAPLAKYLMSSPEAEIALARSAAPPSISAAAEVRVLSTKGYETAVHGSNGFVCLVERSWGGRLDDPELWNPKTRAPMCLNPAAAASILPAYLLRTGWVLAGVSRADIRERTRHELAAKTYPLPQDGAMCFMQSKEGYLGDGAGHWHPHMMIFLSHAAAATWGANLPGSVVIAAEGDPDPVTTFIVPVQRWSDGSADHPADQAHH